MDIEKKIEVILQTVIDDNKEPMTHIQFIKQKNKWVSEIKWLIKSNSLLTSISEQEKYDQGFHDGCNKTAIELSKSDTVEQSNRFDIGQMVEANGHEFRVVEDTGDNNVLISNNRSIKDSDYNDWWIPRNLLNKN